jgi:hypothetical protein
VGFRYSQCSTVNAFEVIGTVRYRMPIYKCFSFSLNLHNWYQKNTGQILELETRLWYEHYTVYQHASLGNKLKYFCLHIVQKLSSNHIDKLTKI